MKHGLLTVDNQGVPRIVPPLETRDGGDMLREQINDLALPFVPPLGSDHHHTAAHGYSSSNAKGVKVQVDPFH